MALNDIIKAKKLVEHRKRSIRNMEQGRQVPRRTILQNKTNGVRLEAVYKKYEFSISESLFLQE
jgi:hypothetical protein